MGISNKNNDYWDNILSAVPYGMYFYFLDTSLFRENGKSNVDVLGNCNAIDSILWTPYLSKNLLDLYRIQYDVERFGTIKGKVSGTPNVFRIYGYGGNRSIDLGNKQNKYQKIYRSELRDWRNESRLYNYPYSYATIFDGMNEPTVIKPHLVNSNSIQVRVKCSISDKCTFGYYVEDYESDNFDLLNVQINACPMDLPVSSSAYAQWSSTQKASALQNRVNAINQNKLAIAQSGISAVGSLANLNFDLSGQVNQSLSAIQNIQQTMKSFDASQTDLLNTPNTIKSGNGNVPFNIANTKKEVLFIRYGLTEDYYKTLGDYFALFGYKQNKILDLQSVLRSRKYYNYVKTVNVNLRSKVGISKSNMNKLKAIFDRGVTIWHGDRSTNFFDYTYDNVEVNYRNGKEKE